MKKLPVKVDDTETIPWILEYQILVTLLLVNLVFKKVRNIFRNIYLALLIQKFIKKDLGISQLLHLFVFI